jgi:hypothetical protein
VFEVEASPGSLVLRRLRRGHTPLPGGGDELRSPDLQALHRGLQKIMSDVDRLSALLEGKAGEQGLIRVFLYYIRS